MKAFLKEDVHNLTTTYCEGEIYQRHSVLAFLMVQTLSMIISSVSILLKIKIKKILINKDNKNVVTFSKALKENQEYPLDILDNIEIKEISNDKFLFIQILNKSLSLGNIRGSKKLSEIGMFIESL